MKHIGIFLILFAIFFTISSARYVPKERQIREDILKLQKQFNELNEAGQTSEADEINQLIQSKFEELKVEREELRKNSPRVPMDHESLEGLNPNSPEYTQAYIQAKIDQYKEEARLRHQRDMEDRVRHGHHRSRTEIDKERHDEHRDHIRERTDHMLSRINRAGFSPEDEEILKKDVDKWNRLEMQSIQARENMGIEFEKARDMHDKEERLAYLEKIRQKRESRRDGEIKVREQARELKHSIEERIRAKLNGGEL